VLVADLDDEALRRTLAGAGLGVRVGPFTLRLTSAQPVLARSLRLLYGPNPIAPAGSFIDFHIGVGPPAGLRRWVRPRIRFTLDGVAPFWPAPPAHVAPLFEWGLNWCIVTEAHRYLMLHAAAIERDGHVAILPGEPGSGKSTLCAALVNRGWRLLTDEITMISLDGRQITPLARPVSLKNASIEVIRRFAPEAVLSPPVEGTSKGTVALMRAPEASIRRMAESARPRWVIFPKYVKDAPATLVPETRGRTLIALGDAGFNYSIHGRRGFEALANLVEDSACFRFSYGHLDDAVAAFAALPSP
jgi:HprK-related kinase A